MTSKRKKEIRRLFGEHLKAQREGVLGIKSIRQFSFHSGIDPSKLTKIEKGKIDIRFETLLEIALAYKLKHKDIFNFDINFWDEELSKE